MKLLRHWINLTTLYCKAMWAARSRKRLKKASQPLIARHKGLMISRNHFYLPVPSAEDVSRPGFWDEESDLFGVAIDDRQLIQLLTETFPPWIDKFRAALPHLDRPDKRYSGFYLFNSAYMAVDAHVYWSMILHLRPRTIVEVGCGNSTLVAIEAVRWLSEHGHDTKLICVEPFPVQFLHENDQITLIKMQLQDIDRSLFLGLEDNDILFIDSSHTLKEGSDVQRLYLDILPQLRSGVYVHVHDISLPRRYAEVYFRTGYFWNEQYLLQAYLTHNSRVKIIWPGSYMMLRHPDEMLNVFPEIAEMRRRWPQSEPTAFWFQVV